MNPLLTSLKTRVSFACSLSQGGWIVRIEAVEEGAVGEAMRAGRLMEARGYEAALAREDALGAREDASKLQY